MPTPKNKDGCWDFYAYTNEHYTDQTGLQPVAIKSMIDRLMGDPKDKDLSDLEFTRVEEM